MAFSTITGNRPTPYLGNGNSGAEPIDLTETDNEDEFPTPEAKRPRANGNSATFIPHQHSTADHLLAQSHLLPPRMSPLPPLSQPLSRSGMWSAQVSPQPFQPRPWGSQPITGQFQPQSTVFPRVPLAPYASGQSLHVTPSPLQGQFGQNNYIDLTWDNSHQFSSPSPLNPFPKHTLVLDESLSQTTTILLGQINLSALVLSPIPYITQHTMNTVLPNGQVLSATGVDYLPVKLRPADGIPDSGDILIYTPNQTRNGNVIAPENFAVLQSKVAARLRPLLVKRAIKLEGMVRTMQNGTNVCSFSLYLPVNLPFLEILLVPLVALVLTAKGNVSQIADVLLKQGLTLERPGSMWSPYFRVNDKLIYHNPHEGLVDTPALAGPSRWSQPPVAARNVEIQRSAADTVFENLRGEEDLPESSPGKYYV